MSVRKISITIYEPDERDVAEVHQLALNRAGAHSSAPGFRPIERASCDVEAGDGAGDRVELVLQRSPF